MTTRAFQVKGDVPALAEWMSSLCWATPAVDPVGLAFTPADTHAMPGDLANANETNETRNLPFF